MNFCVLLHGVEVVIEGVVRGKLREGGKGLLGFVDILAVDGVAEKFAAGPVIGKQRRFDRVKNFLFASASFLNAIGVSVQDFEDGQRLKGVRKFARHVQRRRQRHHRVETDVVFTAEGAGVGEGGG